MQMPLCSEVLTVLRGRTLSTAESLTGGGIGAALPAVPGASEVYRGGVISYVNDVKHRVLGVSAEDLVKFGAVSEPVARQMAAGARKVTGSDVAVSGTGLAGPGGDEFGHSVGTVFLGYADGQKNYAREYRFSGDREAVRSQTVRAARELGLAENGAE